VYNLSLLPGFASPNLRQSSPFLSSSSQHQALLSPLYFIHPAYPLRPFSVYTLLSSHLHVFSLIFYALNAFFSAASSYTFLAAAASAAASALFISSLSFYICRYDFLTSMILFPFSSSGH